MSLHIHTADKISRTMQRTRWGSVVAALAAALGLLCLLVAAFSLVWHVRPQEPAADMVAFIPPDSGTTDCVFPVRHSPWVPEGYRTAPVAVEPGIVLPGVSSMLEDIASLPWEPEEYATQRQDEPGLSDEVALDCAGEVRPGVLMGRVYDLKRLKGGAPSSLTAGGELQVEAFRRKIDDFLAAWDVRLLGSYWRGIYVPYESCFFSYPEQPAVAEPRGAAESYTVPPVARVSIYSGEVMAPVTGEIRFVGAACDRIVVRFAGRAVLDAGPAESPAAYTRGPSFHVREGELYTIQIAVVEERALTGYTLAWQWLSPGDECNKGLNPETLYLFRTSFHDPEREVCKKYPAPLEVSSFVWLVRTEEK